MIGKKLIKTLFDKNTRKASVTSLFGKVEISVTIEDFEEKENKIVGLYVFYKNKEIHYHRMPLTITSLKNTKKVFEKLPQIKNPSENDVKRELDNIFWYDKNY